MLEAIALTTPAVAFNYEALAYVPVFPVTAVCAAATFASLAKSHDGGFSITP